MYAQVKIVQLTGRLAWKTKTLFEHESVEIQEEENVLNLVIPFGVSRYFSEKLSTGNYFDCPESASLYLLYTFGDGIYQAKLLRGAPEYSSSKQWYGSTAACISATMQFVSDYGQLRIMDFLIRSEEEADRRRYIDNQINVLKEWMTDRLLDKE